MVYIYFYVLKCNIYKAIMNATEFVAKLQKVKDKDFQDALNWSVGKIHPLDTPEKFVRNHKKDLNMKKILSEATYQYFMKCTQKSVRAHPKDVVKQVTLELKLKRDALPKIIKNLEDFYPKVFELIPKRYVCNIGCYAYGCFYDHPNHPICKKQFCDDCDKAIR